MRSHKMTPEQTRIHLIEMRRKVSRTVYEGVMYDMLAAGDVEALERLADAVTADLRVMERLDPNAHMNPEIETARQAVDHVLMCVYLAA